MSDQLFQIVFRGFLLPGYERGEVHQNIKMLCKINCKIMGTF